MEDSITNILFMVFDTLALICSICLLSCRTVPKRVKESFTLRYTADTSNIPTTVYHFEYNSFVKKTISGKVSYDTFKNSYDFILYSDFTLLYNFYYKVLEGKKYVSGDWGIWMQKGDTIIVQYINDAREKFNKTFYVRKGVFLLENKIIKHAIETKNVLNPQPEGRYGIVLGTVVIIPIELDSIPPPNSWLKTQEWIYKQP